jgi:hypothetical protein
MYTLLTARMGERADRNAAQSYASRAMPEVVYIRFRNFAQFCGKLMPSEVLAIITVDGFTSTLIVLTDLPV